MSALAQRQMTVLMDLAAAAFQVDSESGWWALAADAVHGVLFHADVMAVNLLNAADGYGWFTDVYPVAVRDAIPPGSAMNQLLVDQHPFSWRCAQGPVFEPMKVTDLVSELRWRSLGGYAAMRELIGVTRHMVVSLLPPPGHVETVSIVRDDPDFTAAEMALAARFQVVARLSVGHLRRTATRPAAELPGASHAARALGITPRERTVLELIDAGLPTNSVGRRLGIAPSTVYKHEQNIYRKLGVNDRVNALRRARQCLLIEEPAPPDLAIVSTGAVGDLAIVSTGAATAPAAGRRATHRATATP